MTGRPGCSEAHAPSSPDPATAGSPPPDVGPARPAVAEPALARAAVGTLTAEPDPDVIAAAVLSCRDVAALRGRPQDGGGAEVATYLPGRRVVGVRVAPGRVTVRVVGRYGAPLAQLARRVRTAVTAAAPTAGRVDVLVDDVTEPPGLRPPPGPDGSVGAPVRQ